MNLILIPVLFNFLFCQGSINTGNERDELKVNSTMETSSSVIDSYVDGTQMVAETKSFISQLHQVPLQAITANYCCQIQDGRYKYYYSFEGRLGFVLWTVIQGEIIGGDDQESY